MSTASDAETIDTESVAQVITEIAELASETLELQEVFDRVAKSIRRIIPFDNMGIVRILDDENAMIHASTIPHKPVQEMGPVPLTSWSPRIRPRPGPNPRFDDAEAELDPSYKIDAMALEGGVRSGMWEPFACRDTLRGGVFLSARQPRAFTDEHQRVMRPIAALLGSAVEHWRIWDAERRRRERLEQVEAMLGTLAESLDVREVFETLSAELQRFLPHHLLNLTELSLKERTIRIVAFAGSCDIPIRTDRFPLSERELENRMGFAIVDDIPTELKPDNERNRLIMASGLRSWLHVPLWMSGEIKGSLSCRPREPRRYTRDDADVALLVAARVALTLSHQRLAEEARVAAVSRERAERLEATVETLSRELESRTRGRVVGNSRSWKEVLLQVGRVAPSDTTVLITGESGTGKEVISKLVHQGSPRASKPLVAINCAALPEPLLESELFGHERGAFTGATASKVGRIEQANGGTLFLDEIAEMTPQMQAKFLRVLEQREFQRVGGTRTIEADVRLIAATNRDLAAAMARGALREDLYYRLNVFPIHLAPLRDRVEDILPLAELFLEDIGRTMARPVAGISADGRDWLLAHSWPGNVRELRNTIERALLLCDGGLIGRAQLGGPGGPSEDRPGPGGVRADPAPTLASGPRPHGPPSEMDLNSVERGLIEKALANAQGNKSRAARLLGLSRAQLYWRLEKTRLDGALRSRRKSARGRKR